MSGEGVMPNAGHAHARMMAVAERPAPRPAIDGLVSRADVAAELEARAVAIECQRSPDLIQRHSRLLPNEVELAEAKFAARQLRVAADDIRAGVQLGTVNIEEND